MKLRDLGEAAAVFIGWPGRVPRARFLAAAYLGVRGGAILGGAFGIVTMAALRTFYPLIFVAAVAIGAVLGLVVGVINGIVMAGVSRALSSQEPAGLQRRHVTVTTVLTTGLASTAILLALFRSDDLLIYVLAIAAALLSWPLSRKLPAPRPAEKAQACCLRRASRCAMPG